MSAIVRERTQPMLETLGISRLEERIYGFVTDAQGATVSEVATLTSLSEAQAESVLGNLEEKGLVSPSPDEPGRFLPIAPDVALRVLILRRREELERAEIGLQHYLSRFRASLKDRAPTHILELLASRDVVVQRYEQIQDAAETEVVTFDRPPYATDASEPNESELNALARGVSYRSLYDSEGLEIPGALEDAITYIKAGEQARTLAGLPMKLTIVDRKVALVAINRDFPEVAGAVVIYDSALLEALVMLFELLWDRAQTLTVDGTVEDETGSRADAQLVGLLAAGLKDETIARQLDLGLRTVARRVHALMEDLGARTRFQAGALAAKRGLL